MTLAAILSVIFLGAFTQGVTGFGNALVVVPLLSFLLPLQVVVPLTILNGLVITSFLSYRMRGQVVSRRIAPLMLGCLPGVGAGTLLLHRLPTAGLRTMLGLVLIAYVLWHYHGKPRRTVGEGWAYLAGFATGLIGACLSAGGPPTIIYTTLTGWDKDEIKATLSGFFLFTGITIGLTHWLTGAATAEVHQLFLYSLPVVLGGVAAGAGLYDRINGELYRRLLLCGLLIMGVLFLLP
ncbi:MAG: sulfite exporter TauE/SafE family protein [Thermodesulfobacteriota bacterium]